MKLLIALSVVMALAVGLWTDAALAVSQAGAISLQFPIGARYNALGEAGTALATDMTALWWNPGGFAFHGRNRASNVNGGVHFMHSPLASGLADDVSLSWLGGGAGLQGWGMVGGAITYLDQGEQTATDEDGNVQGTFNSYQFSISGTLGAIIYDDESSSVISSAGVGLTAKYFRDELAPGEFTKDKDDGTGDTFGGDVGLHLQFPLRRWMTGLGAVSSEGGPWWQSLAFGSVLSNFGKDITFVDSEQADPLPLFWRNGVSLDLVRGRALSVVAIADYLWSLVEGDETKIWGFGTEVGYAKTAFVRLGYKDDPEGNIQDYTWGFGVDFGGLIGQLDSSLEGINIVFDYANVPQAEGLDSVNRFSLAVQF